MQVSIRDMSAKIYKQIDQHGETHQAKKLQRNKQVSILHIHAKIYKIYRNQRRQDTRGRKKKLKKNT